MPGRIRAVIDVGTNSVKLLVGEVDGKRVSPILESSHQTRLGRGFFESHRLQPEAIRETVQAITEFAAQARHSGAGSVRVIATSAARDALNQHELIRAVQDSAQLPIEIISGDLEAEWVFRGVSSDHRFAGIPLLVVDVGGGSTEFVLGLDGRPFYQKSVQLGTVRLLERRSLSDPPSREEEQGVENELDQFLRENVTPDLEREFGNIAMDKLRLIGTGGTATIIARIVLELTGFDREKIESAEITRSNLRQINRRLWSAGLAERKQITGLPPNRADVILFGAAIFMSLMRVFALPKLAVSSRGLRFAALME